MNNKNIHIYYIKNIIKIMYSNQYYHLSNRFNSADQLYFNDHLFYKYRINKNNSLKKSENTLKQKFNEHLKNRIISSIYITLFIIFLLCILIFIVFRYFIFVKYI